MAAIGGGSALIARNVTNLEPIRHGSDPLLSDYPRMTRIAHLSDLHLVEDDHHKRDTAGRLRLSYLSFGRQLDGGDRRRRLRAALAAYRRSGAEHLLITGDLTEDGNAAQFEVLAEELQGSGIGSDEITLIPGNHDAYTSPDAFQEALKGPLQAFAPTSGTGAVTVCDDAVIVPISTLMPQPVARSAGAVAAADLDRVASVARSYKESGRAVAVAQHHQPYGLGVPGLNWIDGLQNPDLAMGFLERHTEVHILHGHRHLKCDRQVAANERPRVFATTACVIDDAPLRLYEASEGRIWPLAPAGTGTPAAVAMPTLGLRAAHASAGVSWL